VKPYLDIGFLLCVLIRSPGRVAAWEQARRFALPWPVNWFQRLQLENALKRGGQRNDPGAQHGMREWRRYLAEMVFAPDEPSWNEAWQLAARWNQETPEPPTLYLLLHPALAVASGASHFLSFDPRSRHYARSKGLTLLPTRL